MWRPPSPEEVRRRFEAAGLALTVQRRAVWEALAGHADHPTTDAVFERVRERLVGLSRTTVYRSLEALVQSGLARRVAHPGAAVRYDARTARHHHAICERCGAVEDVDSALLDALPLEQLAPSGFRVDDLAVDLRGLCRACAGAPA